MLLNSRKQGNQDFLMNEKNCTESTADCAPFHIQTLRDYCKNNIGYIRNRLLDTAFVRKVKQLNLN